jgi:hypothetical protein
MKIAQRLRAILLSVLSLSLVFSPLTVDAATKVQAKPQTKATVQTLKPVPAPKKATVQVPVKTNGTYTNTQGNKVLRPYKAPAAPAGASAKCRDGSYSFSHSRRGTCSGHGGVGMWL